MRKRSDIVPTLLVVVGVAAVLITWWALVCAGMRL